MSLNSIFVYHYHSITYEYTGKDIPDESPLEPGVYLVPAFSTMVPIPENIEIPNNKVFKWNSDEQSWVIVDKITNILNNSEPFVLQDPMNLLRIKRNLILSEWDWVIIRSLSGGPALTEEWISYLNNLRNLPSISTPTLTSENTLDESSVVWPNTPHIPGTI